MLETETQTTALKQRKQDVPASPNLTQPVVAITKKPKLDKVTRLHIVAEPSNLR